MPTPGHPGYNLELTAHSDKFHLLSSNTSENSDSATDAEGAGQDIVDDIPWPWGWSQWQRVTGIKAHPFETVPIHDSPFPWKKQKDVDAVNAFRSNFLALANTQDRIEYMRRARKDDDSHGRELWIQFISGGWKSWNINAIVDEVLTQHNYHPFSVMRRLGTDTVSQLGLFI